MYYDRPGGKKNDKKPPLHKRARSGRSRNVPKRGGGRKLTLKREISAPKKKKHPILKCLLALVLTLVIFLGALYLLPVSFFGSQTAPGSSLKLPSGYTHVLLIGIDTNADNTSRSDTMMILSVGKGRLLLTSLQRDTGVYIEGRSALTRLNAAYSYGGAELLLDTVNRNFGMDISMYILVDYESFPELIDLIGGVDIEGISDEEIEPLNHNVRDVLRRRYEAGEMTWDEIYIRYMKDELTSGGDLHLDGLQALGYARIRKTDSDYMRTLRQRKVIMAALKSLKKAGPIAAVRFAARGYKEIETNMSFLQLLSLGEKALLTSEVKQTRLPVNGTYTDGGSMFYNVDYQKNREAFIEFVYGN